MTIAKLFSCDELPAYGKCEKVQKEICDPVERQVCEEITEKVCQFESRTVPMEKCEDMTVEKCVPVQRDVCKVVAREKCVTVSEEVPFEVLTYHFICFHQNKPRSLTVLPNEIFYCLF